MLIFLHDELLQYVSLQNCDDRVIAAFENLASAHREGKHFILANRELVTKLSDWKELGTRSQNTFRSIKNRLSQNAGLKSKFPIVAGVFSHGPFSSKNLDNDQAEICMPIRFFSDTERIQKSILLCENLNDGEVYSILGRLWLRNSGISFPVDLDLQNGGGGTTHNVYADIQNSQNRFCICILDSDRVFPDDRLGETARKTLESDDNEKPLSKAYVIGGRELENILPTAVLEGASYHNLIDSTQPIPEKMNAVIRLELFEQKSIGNGRLYLELKAASKLNDYISAKTPNRRQYWLEVMQGIGAVSNCIQSKCISNEDCSHPSACQCVFFPGFGNDILKRVKKFLERRSLHEIARDFGSKDAGSKLREDLGAQIASWGFGAQKKVT